MEDSGSSKKLILAAMIFAVSMTFIDQTIVAIAVPQLQQDLALSSTGVQWIINGYLARPSVVLGCLLAAAGFALWAKENARALGRLAVALHGAGRRRRRLGTVLILQKAKEIFSAVQYEGQAPAR